MKLKLAEWTWVRCVASYLSQVHVVMSALGTPMVTGTKSIGKQNVTPAYPLLVRRCWLSLRVK